VVGTKKFAIFPSEVGYALTILMTVRLIHMSLLLAITMLCNTNISTVVIQVEYVRNKDTITIRRNLQILISCTNLTVDTNGHTDRRTDKAATICSPFEENTIQLNVIVYAFVHTHHCLFVQGLLYSFFVDNWQIKKCLK